MHVPEPSAPGPKRSNGAILLLLAASILYGLSLPMAALMLLMSPMMFTSEEAVPTATLLLIGPLGWLVLVIGGMVYGWIKRTMRGALIFASAPLLWALLIVGAVEVVNPDFFNLSDFKPEEPPPIALRADESTFERFVLGTDIEATAAAAGLPITASIAGREVAPAEAVAETVKDGSSVWHYPNNLWVYFSEGKLTQIQVQLPGNGEAPHSGRTQRGVALGDSINLVRERYGEPENKNAESYLVYYGEGFTLTLIGDDAGRVRLIRYMARTN